MYFSNPTEGNISLWGQRLSLEGLTFGGDCLQSLLDNCDFNLQVWMDQDKHLRQIRNTRQNCEADGYRAWLMMVVSSTMIISGTIWNGEHKDGSSPSPVQRISCMGPVNLRNLGKYFNLEKCPGWRFELKWSLNDHELFLLTLILSLLLYCGYIDIIG